MSIIIGFVTKKWGIISSDGRQFGSARFENGRLVEKAKIINESFDKTFSLQEGKIITGSAGLTTFQGKRISEHLEEIIQEVWEEHNQLSKIMQKITDSFKTRLANIDNNEVLFEHRKVDVILILSAESGLTIYAIRFYPNQINQDIQFEMEIIPSQKKEPGIVYWKLFGDDSAQASSIRYFDRVLRKTKNREIAFLEATIRKSISSGINKAGVHPYGDDPSCGGQIFTKIMK